MTMADPFPWHEEGNSGLTVEPLSSATISHEILYEDTLMHVKDQTLFLGAAIPPRRFMAAGIMVAGLIVLLLGRASWMQIVSGAGYRELSDNNRLRHEVVLPRRGVIRDRTGKILAETS